VSNRKLGLSARSEFVLLIKDAETRGQAGRLKLLTLIRDTKLTRSSNWWSKTLTKVGFKIKNSHRLSKTMRINYMVLKD